MPFAHGVIYTVVMAAVVGYKLYQDRKRRKGK